jgi:hypothetical protein
MAAQLGLRDAGPLHLHPDLGQDARMTRMNLTGRENPGSHKKLCSSCQQRILIGEPKARDSWPAQLTLSPHQLDVLLVAAAEYHDLCEETGEPESAVAYVDWVRPDALTVSYESPVKADPPRLRTHDYRRRAG